MSWSLHRPNPSSHETSSSSSTTTNNYCRRKLVIAFLFVAVNLLKWNNNLLISTSSNNSLSSSSSSSSIPFPLTTVAYAISITSCTTKLSSSLLDAASVLRQSILLNSWPLHPTSQYGATFYAFTIMKTAAASSSSSQPLSSTSSLHKDSREDITMLQDECSRILSLAGWEVLPQGKPVHTELIKEPEGSILKKGIGRYEEELRHMHY